MNRLDSLKFLAAAERNLSGLFFIYKVHRYSDTSTRNWHQIRYVVIAYSIDSKCAFLTSTLTRQFQTGKHTGPNRSTVTSVQNTELAKHAGAEGHLTENTSLFFVIHSPVVLSMAL